MKTLRHPIFLASLLLFCLNQVLELLHIYIWPLHTHLDDLLCMPVILTLILAAERLYFRNPYFVLPRHYIVVSVLLFSIVFEGILPLLAAKYTADAWDIVAYVVGALIFHKNINRSMPAQSIEAVK
ncbi:hypothetical protein ABID22_000054 [Pontibacter aydingkolensis]|uniref:Magnesium citrate secondary transporter n=1 Tax=Pontibacter aydingkolensis TaxID=1911536 RepID=A0ABS7CR58_9BACT|nr:magnesium citrate secondary transporter [Pontibacter aydingkolensis]MBW7466273.1 magnesium citrate secondary transporter [Pontibacter aydingkolensis]